MKSVMTHQFSKAPTADIPRSNFNRSHGHKTTFNAGQLIPIYVDEAVPGDTFSVNPTLFARLNTPLYPIMDNMHLDVHFFSVPVRQIWDNFRKFCGEQANPSDSTDYLIPTTDGGITGYPNESLQDYMGIPTLIPNIQHSALATRAYIHIYNEWYRDQNLIDSAQVDTGDGPDDPANYVIRKRGKRHDYFTSALPWLQKGEAINIPLGDTAPLVYESDDALDGSIARIAADGSPAQTNSFQSNVGGQFLTGDGLTAVGLDVTPHTWADLSNATAATVNQLRQAFQIQKLLERDARSGTRYSEIVKSHFGVNFLDVTYRPEFLGGKSTPIQINQTPQTTQTLETGTPQGHLAAYGTATLSSGGFTKSFTEHCIIIGIASVRADLTYQQGLNRMWSRSTRYDFYWPALAHIGEQAVLNKEIYTQEDEVANNQVFGYQERWAEYRYKPSMIAGKLRSNDAQSLDAWHLSQDFGALPALNQSFIEETPPIDRIVAVPSEPDMIMDCYFNLQCARPMPLYSVPGLIDHF